MNTDIEMDILQNSEDYLNQSLELADIADEFGIHDTEKSEYKAKIKWKLSFICIVQALELLCKKCLSEINPRLIYKDIDNKSFEIDSTVNLLTALTRLENFTDIKFDESTENLIKRSTRLRNNFIHYDVHLYTEELKTIYCRLLKLYTIIYTKFINATFYLNLYNSRPYGNLMHYNEFLVIYRGSEINKDMLEEEKRQVEENQKHHVYIRNKVSYKRVVYGDEANRFPEMFPNGLIDSVFKYKYCPDCLAEKGEYHGELCDLEICPRCKGQRLTCGCFKKYHYD